MPYPDGEYTARTHPGSNLEYTVVVDGSMQYITSNGQYAVATSVDTVRISGVVDNMAVTTYRYINPTEVNIIRGLVTVESVQPANATLEITAPVVSDPILGQTHPILGQTQTLRITASNDLEEGVLLFWKGFRSCGSTSAHTRHDEEEA
ncbi:MAG: hypothetical protein LBG28_14810 [Tannerella sp.]|jgi:hypothetical protein|nr:hypothetical protein [Tannerella sp.]